MAPSKWWSILQVIYGKRRQYWKTLTLELGTSCQLIYFISSFPMRGIILLITSNDFFFLWQRFSKRFYIRSLSTEGTCHIDLTLHLSFVANKKGTKVFKEIHRSTEIFSSAKNKSLFSFENFTFRKLESKADQKYDLSWLLLAFNKLSKQQKYGKGTPAA